VTTLLPELPLYDRYVLAQAQLDAGQPLEAARTLEPAAAELPTAGLLLLARAYFGSAQLGRARELLLRVVELAPTDDWARFLLGRVEERRGDDVAAGQHFRLAAALSPRPEYLERLPT
jgi:Flp pilus assembly protein TadD